MLDLERPGSWELHVYIKESILVDTASQDVWAGFIVWRKIQRNSTRLDRFSTFLGTVRETFDIIGSCGCSNIEVCIRCERSIVSQITVVAKGCLDTRIPFHLRLRITSQL